MCANFPLWRVVCTAEAQGKTMDTADSIKRWLRLFVPDPTAWDVRKDPKGEWLPIVSIRFFIHNVLMIATEGSQPMMLSLLQGQESLRLTYKDNSTGDRAPTSATFFYRRELTDWEREAGFPVRSAPVLYLSHRAERNKEEQEAAARHAREQAEALQAQIKAFQTQQAAEYANLQELEAAINDALGLRQIIEVTIVDRNHIMIETENGCFELSFDTKFTFTRLHT